jgi:cellulose synthase/poly-beta-1,6-N-acetylglucosamine synthase-like glycosyltransferase
MLIPWEWIILGAFALVTLIQLFYYLHYFKRVAYHIPQEWDQSQEHPVSVVICARDEAANLADNLPGVLVQNYHTTHEVVLVNDNSQDETRYLLEGLHKQFRHLNVVELKQEAILIPGKKFPLSMGIKSARHEVVLLTDADCIPASEHWIYKMQQPFRDSIEIVLSYGAYHKTKSLLNKIIRFDAFHGALQYLSYALAGNPYMGVGRNLAYKKQLFYRHKGFSSHNHVPGGDDDLFINMAATKDNVTVVIDEDAYTLSKPQTSFGRWYKQKTRHYSTAKFYKGSHRFLLGLYSATQFLFWPLFVLALILGQWPVWPIALGLLLLRLITQAVIFYRSMAKLNERDLFPLFLFFDIFQIFQYIIFFPALLRKPKPVWK